VEQEVQLAEQASQALEAFFMKPVIQVVQTSAAVQVLQLAEQAVQVASAK
jgi:hypothetical protein